MGEDSRWRRLDIYDRILDGKLYDHLKYSFYDEYQGERYIPLIERRPSSQYRLARYVARTVSRKLFAGRHVPKVKAPDEKTEKRINDLLTGSKIWPTMFEAAYRGSVGSVAVTFRVEGKKIGLKVWRALWCSPFFDDFAELALLRIHYVSYGWQLAAIGVNTEFPERQYWFIRDYTPTREITYAPVLSDDWNPVSGFVDPTRVLVEGEVIEHNLGFVPGIWIMNPGGVSSPDGCALWEDGLPNMIEVDYLLSQASRGARYSCAPQLVTVGELLMEKDRESAANPATVLHFAAPHRDGESGESIGGGDAKLLEMQGTGAEAALKIIEVLKKYGLEQIGLVQKDPGEMPGPLSGRAMDYLDEDSHDTAMQWRTTYGEGGALPIICKMLQVLDPKIDTTKLWLQWPRIYQPTPGDLQAIVQALVMASSPTQVAGQSPSEDGSVAAVAPLLDPKIASAYLLANLDLGILDDTAGDSPVGPSGGEPDPAGGDNDPILGQYGPFWRIYPPIRVGG